MEKISKLNFLIIFMWLVLPLFSASGKSATTEAAVLGATQQVPTAKYLAAVQNSVIDITAHAGELCQRACVAGEPRICYFKFTLEHYQAMGVACGDCARGVTSDCERAQCIVGDGTEKGVMSINRQIPGPALHVCQHDLIVVDVVNQAHGTAATIHWHGMHMLQTPFMDGVPFLTQCPIPFANTFRYQFIATESGTHFYHSHAGHHKINGHYGAMIVRAPEELSPNLAAYDYDLPEHYVLISDWMHSYAEQLFPGLPGYGGIFPDSMLINGRGSYINPKTGARKTMPPQRFVLKAGKRYRVRVINAVSHACPVQLQIEQHRLNVIATDGYEVEPLIVDTLVTNSGERYDFVLEANTRPGDYWLHARGMGVCAIEPTEAFLLLSISSELELTLTPQPEMPLYKREYEVGTTLNHPNTTCLGYGKDRCVNELKAMETSSDWNGQPADYKFLLSFDNYPVAPERLFKAGHYPHFANFVGNLSVVGLMNNMSFIFPDYPPLTQPEQIDETQFCDDSHWPQRCQGLDICSCTHRLQVPLGSIVELTIVDETERIGRMHHPFHVHGHRFTVNGLGQHPLGIPMTRRLVQQMEQQRMLLRTDYFNAQPPFKDTVSIPSRGYAVLRFRADNPGFWLIHCHYEWHMAIGMGLVLQVGDVDQMQTPPKDFPRCGNYMPPVEWPL